MKTYILIFIGLIYLNKINAQIDTINIGESVPRFIEKFNNNFDKTGQFYGKKTWQIWNDMACEFNLSVYANDSLRNPRFICLFMTDIHNNWGSVDRVYDFVKNSALNSRVRHIIFNGDHIINWAGSPITKTSYKSRLDSIWNKIDSYSKPIYLTLGNHESNSEYTSDTTYAISKKQQREWIIDKMVQKQQDVKFHLNIEDEDGCYYYVDDAEFKIRMMFLDFYDVPQTVTGSNFDYPQQLYQMFSEAQLKFIADSALALIDSTWQIMFFGHPGFSSTDNSAESLITIINAFKNKASVNVVGNKTYNPYTVSVNYAEINGFYGKIIGFWHGHGHESSAEYSNFWNIEVPSVQPNSYYTTRIIGTSTEDCADFIIIDKLQRQIRSIRYGAGANNYQTGTNIRGDWGVDTKMEY